MTIHQGDRPTVQVVESSVFEATCDCEDYEWHRDYDQSDEELKSRKLNANKVEVTDIKPMYGTVVACTRTSDSKSSRPHEVILSRGGGIGWVCKHIIATLRTKALMPNSGSKELFLDEGDARVFAARRSDSIVTSCNSVWVVGYAPV